MNELQDTDEDKRECVSVIEGGFVLSASIYVAGKVIFELSFLINHTVFEMCHYCRKLAIYLFFLSD